MADAQKARYPAALALGALALGAFAVGALAVGCLAIGRLVVKRARIGRLEVDELVIRRIQRPTSAARSLHPKPAAAVEVAGVLDIAADSRAHRLALRQKANRQPRQVS